MTAPISAAVARAVPEPVFAPRPSPNRKLLRTQSDTGGPLAEASEGAVAVTVPVEGWTAQGPLKPSQTCAEGLEQVCADCALMDWGAQGLYKLLFVLFVLLVLLVLPLLSGDHVSLPGMQVCGTAIRTA